MHSRLNRYKILIYFLIVVCAHSCGTALKSSGTYGAAYGDKQHRAGPQLIPGKVHCEFFDFGGEGIAYHDSDSENSGSGRLNKPDGSYLNEFRMGEGVDISYTKFRTPPIDNTEYNFVMPQKDELYVGWTEPGEWLTYTVAVKRSGIYRVGLMYTSRYGGQVSLAVNGEDRTGALEVPSTYVRADTVAWRQWHHWNYIGNLAAIKLEKGLQKLTLHTVEKGQMNYDYLLFELIE